MNRILIQTTIGAEHDDWYVGRFSRLAGLLSRLRTDDGSLAFEVVTRNRQGGRNPDPVLSSLDSSGFQQVWLIAADAGEGLSRSDCEGINRFRASGGSLLVARDHMDLGCSICALDGVGEANHFHSHNQELDGDRRCRDNHESGAISWPNYNSGANGGYQRVRPVGSIHPVMVDRQSPTGVVQYLPAHPHEGAIAAPRSEGSARAVVEGTSVSTARRFNIAVAFERSSRGGRAIVQSSFHHFADYNWDPSAGCPSFVSETPVDTITRSPEALRSTMQYVKNIAFWLGGVPS